MRILTYGTGGTCFDCDPTHDHPLHNIIEVIDLPDEQETE